MSSPSLWRRFVAPRTTVAILLLLAVLVALFVVVPQESVLGEERFAEITAEDSVRRVLLVDLGLGRLSTSPIFLGTLALFFANLVAVVGSRIRVTLRRIAVRPLAEQGLGNWARQREDFGGDLPDGWSGAGAAEVLRGFGYAVRRPGERAIWGVKHRLAPLGFLLFHASFLLMFGGAVLLFFTRFSGTAVVTEGQRFAGGYTSIARMPLFGSEPAVEFEVYDIEARRENGEPTHLGATIRVFGPMSRTRDLPARVNAPAKWGSVSVLVDRAGLSPVVWLQDERGFTLDRVASPVRAGAEGEPTEVPLADDRYVVRLYPPASGSILPGREKLPTTALRVALVDPEDERVLVDAELRPGEALSAVGARLVLEEIRYWIQLNVVSERGGGLLIAGFVLATVGLTWRLVLYRREVGLSWTESEFRLAGRCENFSHQFRAELEAISAELGSGAGSNGREGNEI